MAPEEVLEVVSQALANRFYGKYRGKVVNNVDPEGRARLQVLIPEVLGQNTPRWALPASPYAGDQVGFFALPPVNASVWVEFEAGNLKHPIWSGCFWGQGEIPAADATPETVFLRTRGASLTIDDAQSLITIETSDGAKVTIGGGEIKLEGWRITCDAQGGKTELTAAAFDAKNGTFKVI